jgi:hypothetical protein
MAAAPEVRSGVAAPAGRRRRGQDQEVRSARAGRNLDAASPLRPHARWLARTAPRGCTATGSDTIYQYIV